MQPVYPICAYMSKIKFQFAQKNISLSNLTIPDIKILKNYIFNKSSYNSLTTILGKKSGANFRINFFNQKSVMTWRKYYIQNVYILAFLQINHHIFSIFIFILFHRMTDQSKEISKIKSVSSYHTLF